MKDLIVVHASALPESAQVLGFRGHEVMSRPYVFDVYVNLTHREGAGVDPADAIGTRAMLGFRHDLLAVPFHFHGVISEMELVHEVDGGRGGDRSVFRLRLVPQLWALGLSMHSRIFTKKSIPEVISTVLEDAGLGGDFELRLSGAYAVEEHVCQYRESDLAFITRWMEHEGLYYFFEHGGASEKLVITDDLAVHEELRPGAVPYHPAKDDELAGEALHFATLARRTLPADVVVQDYDYAKPALDVLGTAAVSPDGLAHVSVYGDRVFSPESAKRVAAFRAQALLAMGKVLKARGTHRHLRSGYRFQIADHPRAEISREWLATKVEHVGRVSHGVSELDELIADKSPEVYRVAVEAIPSDVVYREQRSTPWPRIHGFENGVVDGPSSSQYAQVDEQGRYAIKLRFDEGPGKDGQASTWVRMAQPHGGGIEGFHFPLRKGTEVLVQFLDGDPDRPVIGAVLPNAATPSPVTSGNNTKNVLQTGGSTRMEIEDLGGGQYMHTTTPVQNTGMWMGTDATSAGGHNTELYSGGSAGKSFGTYFDRFIGGTKSEHVVGDVGRSYDSSFFTNVLSNVQEAYESNQSTTVKSSALRTITGTLTDTVKKPVEQKYSSTWTQSITSDVGQTFQSKLGFEVKAEQAMHVLAKGEGTHEVGLAVTVNGALSKHVATAGYKLEAKPDANTHVTANLKIRGDVNAVFSSPDTTVDGDTSVLIDAGSKVEAKAQEIGVVGSASIKLTGPKIDILGGDVLIKGGNISFSASTNVGVKAEAQVVAATAGINSINGGPHATFTAGLIALNVMAGDGSGLGLAVDALLALDSPVANRLAELMKAGWTIQYGEPGSGSYIDRARKIIVLDPSLQSDPQATAETLSRLSDRALNPATPQHMQEEPNSCAMASSRMVIDSQTGIDPGEATLRNQSSQMPNGYNPQSGTVNTTVDDLLRQNGVPNAAEPRPLSVDDLATHTANGDPAIVSLNHYDANGDRVGGHAIVVDGVTTNPDGTRNILIRDPASGQMSMPEDQFMNNYYNSPNPGQGHTSYRGVGITTDGSGDTGP